MMRISVDLPQPLGPTSATNSPSPTGERDVAQRLDRAAVGPVDHADPVDLDQRTARGHVRRRSQRSSLSPAHLTASGIATLVRNSVV